MTDAELTLDKGESIKVHFWQETSRGIRSVFIFVHQNSDGSISISCDTNEDQRDDIQIEITHGVITKFERKDTKNG